MISPSSALTLFASIVARSLADAGVSRLVVSPGSRSTPFVLACAAEPRLELVSVVDERVAAFVALGLARESARPTAVLATSGTAPAHWFPAIIEASLSNLPLVCLSADRPSEVFASSAAQTIDQIKLFGDQVRFFADLGDPSSEASYLRGARRLVLQAISASRGPVPGPVHLNLRARKPLEPIVLDAEASQLLETISSSPVTAAEHSVAHAKESIHAAREALLGARRPLVVAGPIPLAFADSAAALLDHAARLGLPVHAEATSHARFLSHSAMRLSSFDLWLATELRANTSSDLLPDLVVQLGTSPTSAALERWLGAANAPRRIVLGAPQPNDPYGHATAMLLGPIEVALDDVFATLEALPLLDVAARDELVARDRTLTDAIAKLLADRPFGEHRVATVLASELPPACTLFVGNSLPIRMLDRATSVGRGPGRVGSQRGANGIDGLASQSVGVAKSSERPVCLYLGDLSLLHDLGALVVARTITSPLLLVVVENGGGRIFETLPIGKSERFASSLGHFTTDTALDWPSLARGFGIPSVIASDGPTLREALREALERRGPTLIVAQVAPHDARDVELLLEQVASRAREAALRGPS